MAKPLSTIYTATWAHWTAMGQRSNSNKRQTVRYMRQGMRQLGVGSWGTVQTKEGTVVVRETLSLIAGQPTFISENPN